MAISGHGAPTSSSVTVAVTFANASDVLANDATLWTGARAPPVGVFCGGCRHRLNVSHLAGDVQARSISHDV
jgi:hypothetical protein|tara:strand:- start:769 stop:984 length:216 start_codon:yes stop_codon:yes gene_type:complete